MNFFCSAMLVFAVFAAGPIRLESTVEMGRAPAYRVEHDAEIEVAPDAGDGRLVTTRHAADLRLVPRRVERDGSASFALMFDRIEIESDGGGQGRSFEWTRADSPAPTGDADTDAVRAGQVLATTIPVVSIDAGGRVTEIQGLGPFLDEAAAMGDGAPFFAGFFTPGGLGVIVQDILCADGSARVAVRGAGSGWETVRRTELPPIGEVEIVTDWSLSVSGDEATLAGVSAHRVIPRESADPASPSAQVTEAESATSVRWDLAGDGLIERRTQTTITSRWTLGGRSLTQTQRSTRSITRLERATVPEPPAPGP